MPAVPAPSPEREAAAAFPPPPENAHAFAAMLDLDGATMADLERYRALLTEWSGRMNLVGPSALAQFWSRHAYDSAQLLDHAPDALRIADLGAGAGFPGVVLAILLKARPGVRIDLVESQAKRCRFLSQVVGELRLPATIHHARAEAMRPQAVEIVTARACAPLARLFDYALPYARIGARGLFLKGRGVEGEIAEARRSWRFRCELLPSRSDPEGRIVSVEGLARA